MPAVAILALLLAASPQIDAGAAVLVEAWDLNGSHEVLTGLVVGAEYPVWRGIAVRGEGLALHVAQPRESAWLRGVTVGTRLRWSARITRPFVDVAVGLSNASRPVPAGGTRFNYLAVIGVGVERQVRGVMLGVTGRWLHASNNGRVGRHRNPDIQSLGAIVSVGWKH